jgi:hypothetical protein
VRRFALAAVARIRDADARRSARAASTVLEEARRARDLAAALEAKVGPPGGTAPGEAAGPRLRLRAAELARDARSRERRERARRVRAAEAAKAGHLADLLAGEAARAAEEALLGRRRAGALARAEMRWRDGVRREREAREEREVEEAWAARPRGSRPG